MTPFVFLKNANPLINKTVHFKLAVTLSSGFGWVSCTVPVEKPAEAQSGQGCASRWYPGARVCRAARGWGRGVARAECQPPPARPRAWNPHRGDFCPRANFSGEAGVSEGSRRPIKPRPGRAAQACGRDQDRQPPLPPQPGARRSRPPRAAGGRATARDARAAAAAGLTFRAPAPTRPRTAAGSGAKPRLRRLRRGPGPARAGEEGRGRADGGGGGDARGGRGRGPAWLSSFCEAVVALKRAFVVA